MDGFIDIEYETLKEAIKQIEKKKKICEKLPSARFTWEWSRHTGGMIQVGNHMPVLNGLDAISYVSFQKPICDRLKGRSTGTSAKDCQNCLREKESKIRRET